MPKLNDYGKLAALIAAMACTSVLAALNVVPGAAAIGIVTIIVGYLTGNGVLARKRQPPSPALVAPHTVPVLVEHPGDPARVAVSPAPTVAPAGQATPDPTVETAPQLVALAPFPVPADGADGTASTVAAAAAGTALLP
jgi:hypothetical protein